MGLPVMTVVRVAVLFFGLSTAGVDAAIDAAIASRFKVDWTSVQYSKNVVVRNPKVSSPQEEVTKSLWLSCEVEISDPNLVLGTSRGCVVTQLMDGKGQKVKVVAFPRMLRQSYEGLRYHERFAQPPKVSRWRAYLRSLLKLPQNANFGPQRVTELRPSQFRIQLDKELLNQDNAEIGRLKGYFHALVAESYVYVDVPFEPNDHWVSLTSGVAIRVREASSDGFSYRFRIETDPPGGELMHPIQVGRLLPDRIVIGRQFIGKDGKPTGRHRGFSHVPAPIGGSGSGGGSGVETIRFTIAVNPAHHKIPFEFVHIPVPDPEP